MVNRQHFQRPALYGLVGVLQWLVDSAVMVGLSHAGFAVALATLCGRISGAACGFWLNGRITFASPHAQPMRNALPRFLIFWLAATALSAAALGWIDSCAGLHLAWLSKPCVDAAMAVAGYLASRHWIYRSSKS